MNAKDFLRPLPIIAMALIAAGAAKMSGVVFTSPTALAAAEAKPVPALPPGSKAAPKPAAAGSASQVAAEMPLCPSDDVAGQAGLSAAEFRLLQSLQERRQALDQREQDIANRDAVVKAAEQRIADRTAAMKAVETNISKLLGKVDEQEAERVSGLVKVYEKMKPKDAARILEGLEDEILFKVASRMKTASMSLVLAQMNSERARKLTAMLANADRALIGTPKQPLPSNATTPAKAAPKAAAAQAPPPPAKG
jgi:flagellar motility protein MotE (MotC chaperone)